ncbi:MAG: hypothetical protein LUC90_04300 [Lachnospiraceae bacterium]|nr:hypothetical protein [Lachnospiraceae bacterium]
MKQRSKILAGLTAGVMAFSAVCFGFSQWSTDISLNGNVSANGRWDVAITDASVEVSTGAAFTTEATVASEAYEVVVTYTEKTGYYHLALDTAKGIQSNVDLSDYTKNGTGYYNSAWTSENSPAYITGDSVGTSNTWSAHRCPPAPPATNRRNPLEYRKAYGPDRHRFLLAP